MREKNTNADQHLRAKAARELEVEFYKNLAALASVCKFNLTEDVAQLYDEALSHFGYSSAIQAIRKTFMLRKANDPFPPVSELIEKTDSRISDQAQAQEVADRIWLAVAQWGWTNPKIAKERVGELGALVIDRVGWPGLCEQPSSAAQSVKAQLREAAKSILEARRHDKIQQLLGGPNAALPLASEDRKASKESDQPARALGGPAQGHTGVGSDNRGGDRRQTAPPPTSEGETGSGEALRKTNGLGWPGGVI